MACYNISQTLPHFEQKKLCPKRWENGLLVSVCGILSSEEYDFKDKKVWWLIWDML